MAVRRDGNQSGSRKKPASQGHPSQGRPTVGGGTKTPPTVYKSPTPTPRAPASQGHPSQGRPTVGGGTKGKAKRYRSPTPTLKRQRKINRKKQTQRDLRRATRTLTSLHLDKPKDTDTHIGPLNLEAELEGRGGIAKASEFAKKVATSNLGRAGARTAGVPTTGNKKLDKNLIKDVVDFPAQTVPGAYAIGASAVEAAQGRPHRAKKVWRDFKMHDPIALEVRSKLEGRPELHKRAGKEIAKHPGLFAAEVSGVGSAVSKTAGAGVRAAGRAGRHAPTKRGRRVGKKLRQIGSTKRAPKVAPGTGMRETRSYPKGLIGKTGQYALERHRVKKARKLREQAKRAKHPETKANLRAEANIKDPRVMSNRDVAKRTNEREDLAEINRRGAVGQAAHEARQVLPKDPKARRVGKRLRRPANTPKDHRSAVSLLVAQKIVKPNRESILGYRNQINRELKSLTGARYRTARRLRDQLNSALADSKLDFAKLEQSATSYSELVVPRQKALVERGMLPATKERKAKLVGYAVQEMGAKPGPKGPTLHGEPLPADAIEAHMRANGIDPATVPYVPQAPNARGARNFYSSWSEPKNAGGKTRTGEATAKGTFEADRELGAENVARMEGLIKGADSYTQWVGENAYRGRNGKVADHSFNTRDEALQFVADNLQDSPYEWTAVPTRPQFGRSEQSKNMLERADAQGVAETRGVQEAIADALTNGNGDGKFVLVPKVAADTQAQHARFLGSKGLKVTRKVGRQFSGTVLATSGFTWPLGNVAEGIVRLAVMRAGPASNKLARATIAELKKFDPDAARDLENRAGTGHLGSYEMQRVHTVAREFNGTTFEPMAKALGALFRAPGPKQVGQVWGHYTRLVFGKNGALEHQLRLTALGRNIKNQGFHPQWLKDGPKAMQKAAEQAAQGMKGTNEQVAAARFVDRAMGKYSRWSPEQRFAIAVFTPFVAWSANAVKFFVDVLPRDHPVLLGLLASSERATEEWRNAHGLGKFVDGAAPGFMQASIVSGDKLLPVGRYTPAGLFADPLGTAGGLLMPAFTGIEMATKGLDWKGDPLNGHKSPHDVTDAEKLQGMAKSAMGSFIPFFGLKDRIKAKGTAALNPVKAYAHNTKVSAAYQELDRINAEKAAIKAKHPKVDSDHPTPEYEKLHRRFRALNELIFKESKGQYGTKYKEPYNPGGSGGFFDNKGPAKEKFFDGGGSGTKKKFFGDGQSNNMSPVTFNRFGLEPPTPAQQAARRHEEKLRRQEQRRVRNYLMTPQSDYRENPGDTQKPRRRTNDGIFSGPGAGHNPYTRA